MGVAADAKFTAFVERERFRLARAAYLLTGDFARAEDLVKECLVRTYLAWSRIGPDAATGHAARLLVRLSLRGWRWRRHVVRDPRPFAPARASRYAAVALHDPLAETLGQLPPDQRGAAVLLLFGDPAHHSVPVPHPRPSLLTTQAAT